jgi:hypothetical protein
MMAFAAIKMFSAFSMRAKQAIIRKPWKICEHDNPYILLKAPKRALKVCEV